MNKYYNEYIELVNKTPELCREDAAKMRVTLENSTAHYHGYTVHTLYIPNIYTQDDLEKLRSAAETTYSILNKVINEYLKNEDYRKLFGFDKKLEELILRPSVYNENLPIARIDLFYDPEAGNFKFCEFNTDGSSGMNEDRELVNVFKTSETFKTFSEKHSLKTFELFDSWVHEFESIYNSSSLHVENPHVAIVDFMSSASNEEFEEFKRAFERAGYSCEICDIYKLNRTNEGLISPTGKKIDAVYRRAVTCDIMLNYDKVLPFIDAALNNEVVLIGDFRTQIVHNKLIFKILRDDMTKSILTDAENKFVEDHIPKTYDLTHDIIHQLNVLNSKNKWIVKPSDSYASKGVLAGIEAKSDEEWLTFLSQHMNTDYLLQEYVTPYETKNLDILWYKNDDYVGISNITGMFVYNGHLQGLYSRAARTGVISTQYSEMTLPTMIAEN